MWQTQLLGTGQNMTNIGMVGPVLGVAFLGQFLAGLWNLTKGDTFGAVAMCSYGLFWSMYGYLILPAGNGWAGTGSYNPFGALAMITYGATPIADGGAGFSVIESVNLTNTFIGYCCSPWLILTFIFICCALRMALLELWIFINVELVFICVLGSQFSAWEMTALGPVPGASAVKWTKALGAFSLMLAMTAWYFIAVILVNQTYNAGILPMGHSHPIIEAWPHEFGSVKHQETHRNLNLYIPEKKMHRMRSDETPYNPEDMYHRSHNAGMGPAPINDLEKRV
jgi:succinate-acetate transporter protein